MATVLNGGEVISAIANAIYAAVTTQEVKAIYKNKATQGMDKPCVFIQQINQDRLNEMKGRGERIFLYDIRVHPSTDQTQIESWGHAIAEKIMNAITKVTVISKPLKVTKMGYSIQEDVVHILASYKFKVIEQTTPEELMQHLIFTEEVR